MTLICIYTYVVIYTHMHTHTEENVHKYGGGGRDTDQERGRERGELSMVIWQIVHQALPCTALTASRKVRPTGRQSREDAGGRRRQKY